MRLTQVLPVLASLALMPTTAHAALVSITVSGTTAESDGSLMYSPDSAFSAVITFDDAFSDQFADPNTGGFFDFGSATTALVSFELTTELGTIFYDYSQVTGFPLTPQVTQIQGPGSQSLNVVSHFDLSGGTGDNGWSGSMGALDPNSFTFNMAASGMGNYIFDDPNVLLSGAVDGLDTGADIYGGIITVSDALGHQTTELVFAEANVSFVSGVPAVPEPASWSLMIIGLGLAGIRLRRRSTNLTFAFASKCTAA